MHENAQMDLKYFRTNNVSIVEPKFQGKTGYQYAELNHGRTLSEQLNSLAEYQKNLWVKETGAVTILRCPQCNADNQCVSFQCQLCSSSNISRGSAVQHDRCGNIDFDYNFVTEDGSMHCKKCNKDLKAIGVDYSRLGSYFKCHKCNVLLPAVERHYQCFECGRGSNEEELIAVRLPTYSINRDGLADVPNSVDLNAIAKEVESLGIKAVPNSSIAGLSRINHSFAMVIYDKRDLPLLVAEVVDSRSIVEDSILSFLARCNDAKILNKVIIANKIALDEDLRELAEINNVSVVESDGTGTVPSALIDCVKQAINKSSVQVA